MKALILLHFAVTQATKGNKKDVIIILNSAQREWIDKQKNFINQQINNNYPLSDSQWKLVADTVDGIIKKAKGHEKEVRKEMFNLIEKWDRKAKDDKR